jgi:hypothetical protein
MLKEEFLHPLRLLFADLEVVRRVQIDQREGFDRAMHVKAVPMNHVDAFAASLLSSSCVQFNAVAQNLLVRSDFSERNTIPHARIERTALLVGECQEFPYPLCLWKR